MFWYCFLIWSWSHVHDQQCIFTFLVFPSSLSSSFDFEWLEMMCTEQNASVRANNCTRSCSKKTLGRLESFTFFHQFPTGRAGKIRKIQLLMLACILRAFLRMKLLRGQLQIDGGKRLRYTYDSHVSRSYQNRVPSKYISYCILLLYFSFVSSVPGERPDCEGSGATFQVVPTFWHPRCSLLPYRIHRLQWLQSRWFLLGCLKARYTESVNQLQSGETNGSVFRQGDVDLFRSIFQCNFHAGRTTEKQLPLVWHSAGGLIPKPIQLIQPARHIQYTDILKIFEEIFHSAVSWLGKFNNPEEREATLYLESILKPGRPSACNCL